MVPSQVTFEQALEDTARCRRHLLLGNGFSLGPCPSFSFRSLNEEACKLDSSLEAILPPGIDFEQAMRRASPSDCARLREAFIQTIANIHPRSRTEALDTAQMEICADFMGKFFRRRSRYEGRVFTTNYDLILYWIIVAQQGRLQSCGDGLQHQFTWHGDREHKARVYYLHGGLHLYEKVSQKPSGPVPVITKLQSGTGPAFSLPALVRTRVNGGDLPIFVSEGSSADKAKRIDSNDYLRTAYLRFEEACNAPDAALFVYGHGLGKVDSHIINAVTRGCVPRVYIGWHSPSDRERFERLADWWQQKRAAAGKPVIVATFDSKNVPVWATA